MNISHVYSIHLQSNQIALVVFPSIQNKYDVSISKWCAKLRSHGDKSVNSDKFIFIFSSTCVLLPHIYLLYRILLYTICYFFITYRVSLVSGFSLFVFQSVESWLASKVNKECLISFSMLYTVFLRNSICFLFEQNKFSFACSLVQKCYTFLCFFSAWIFNF